MQHYQSQLQHFQSHQRATAEQQVAEFGRTHPRFEELAGDIGKIISGKIRGDLEGAYRLAELWNPLPDAARNGSEAAPVAPPAATARNGAPNPKTTLSISGAPSAGSNPANRPTSKSSQDSIDYAFSKAFGGA
jgi:hypothetical protein